jgi:hypothetical protein
MGYIATSASPFRPIGLFFIPNRHAGSNQREKLVKKQVLLIYLGKISWKTAQSGANKQYSQVSFYEYIESWEIRETGNLSISSRPGRQTFLCTDMFTLSLHPRLRQPAGIASVSRPLELTFTLLVVVVSSSTEAPLGHVSSPSKLLRDQS